MKIILILLIKLYQNTLGILTRGNCRFDPSCSNYAIESLKKYGFFKGIFLSLKRISKCNGYNKGGKDPVP